MKKTKHASSLDAAKKLNESRHVNSSFLPLVPRNWSVLKNYFFTTG
jgi:hypothetical protein